MKFPRLKYTPGKNIDGNPIAMAPVVYTLTPPNGPWSGSNNLGQVVDFSDNALNSQMILKLDEWGPPDMWTVSLGVDRNDGGVPNIKFQIQAEIIFGVGGATQTVLVDWRNGTQLCLPMNAVAVHALYGATEAGGGFTLPPDLRLSVLVARGTARSFVAPTLTHYTDALSGVDNYQLPIPRFARRFKIVWIDPAVSPIKATTRILVNSAVGGAIIEIYPTASLVNYASFDLPNGAYNMIVADTEVDPNRTDAFRIIFELGV